MKHLLLLLILFSWTLPAYSEDCSQLLLKLWKASQEKTYTNTTAIEKYLKTLVDDPDFYHNYKLKFARALNYLPQEEAQQVNIVLESLRYIDYQDHAGDLLNIYLDGSRSLDQSLIPKLYNNGDYDYFRQLSQTKEWIRSHTGEIDIDFITKAHSQSMAGSGDLFDEEIGAVRRIALYGDETFQGLTKQEIEIVNSNPFLRFDTPALATGRTKGNILYTDANNVKDEALEIIRPYYPELRERLVRLRGSFGMEDDAHEELITALTNSVLKNFYKKTHELSSVAQYRDYIESVATLYRDLISIHPLTDGNGRTLRETVLYNLLDSKGIARPRLSNPDYDYLFTVEQWVEEVEQGIVSTHRLYKDMEERLELGLPLSNSAELLYPRIPREVMIAERKQGSSKVLENVHLMFVDSRQFGAYVDTRITIDANLEPQIYDNPLKQMQELSQEFSEFSKKHRFVFTDSHGTSRGVGVSLVDRDFYWNIDYPVSSYKNAWDDKMKRYYTQQTVWRGLPYNEMPDDEYIRSLFFYISDHTVSMRIQNRWAEELGPDQIVDMAREDFVSFNKDLINNTIAKMAYDHHTEGELYEQSIYFSTSFKHGTAVSFAKGSYQGQESVGIVVGMRQPRASLEVNRLRAFDPEFRARYPRQDEVLIPGAADPDSIIYVQLVDRRGNVLKTYSRDAEDPSHILVNQGDIQ